jgi:hypothetical protein
MTRRILAAAVAVGLALTPPSLPIHAQQEQKWDVGADLGPTSKLAFDTSEGTWMNVDVSPDGKRVVFICSATSTSCRSTAAARRRRPA